jgi:hypothetical protein
VRVFSPYQSVARLPTGPKQDQWADSCAHTPKGSPNLNGRCERFIGTIRWECLDKFIVFGKRHLDYLISEFVSYCNNQRSQMERKWLPPVREEPEEVDTLKLDQIEVKSFERKAASHARFQDDPTQTGLPNLLRGCKYGSHNP